MIYQVPGPPTAAAQRLARRVIRRLSAMRDGMQSGPDSGLLSLWDEVCVQMQGEASPLWWAYEQTIGAIVRDEVERLPAPAVLALWLDTDAGEDWLYYDQEPEADAEIGSAPAPDPDDVMLHILQLVYNMAADWSNRRLRRYFARHSF